jgi:hypothetical protein
VSCDIRRVKSLPAGRNQQGGKSQPSAGFVRQFSTLTVRARFRKSQLRTSCRFSPASPFLARELSSGDRHFCHTARPAVPDMKCVTLVAFRSVGEYRLLLVSPFSLKPLPGSAPNGRSRFHPLTCHRGSFLDRDRQQMSGSLLSLSHLYLPSVSSQWGPNRTLADLVLIGCLPNMCLCTFDPVPRRG